MQKGKEVSHNNDDGLGVGGDDTFERSCSFCLILNFWGKQVVSGRETPAVCRRSTRPHQLLTGMLQELAGALCGKEGFLQGSKVELQHSCNRIQVARPLSEGILSYQANTELSSKSGGGVSAHTHTQTDSLTSFKFIS